MADRESLEDRVPCSDEMCVGIIGTSGRCGVCGKPGTPPPSTERIEHPHDDLHSTGTSEPEPEAEPKAAADDEAIDPSDRVPCPDEMCVGILSPERRCGTCGRMWPAP